MSWVMVDVEASGPLHGYDRMTEFGAIIVREPLVEAFHGILTLDPGRHKSDHPTTFKAGDDQDVRFVTPVNDLEPDIVVGYPGEVMTAFSDWLDAKCVDGKACISDNNGFDWGWINWYSWKYLGEGIFGHSSQNLGAVYKGMIKHMGKNFKHLRQVEHTHNPVDDALGNAIAMVHMHNHMGLKVKLI